MPNTNYEFKWLSETRTMHCKVCNEPVPVNINYPIHDVTCKACYDNQQSNHELVGNT